jgi:hypothetical protein
MTCQKCGCSTKRPPINPATCAAPLGPARRTRGSASSLGTVTAGQYISFTFVVTHTGAYSQQVTNVVSYSQGSSAGSAQAPFTVEPTRVFLPIVLKPVR